MIQFKTQNIFRLSFLVGLGLLLFNCAERSEVSPELSGAPSVADVQAAAITVSCSTPECVQSAMLNAQPGDIIRIEPGTYTGSTSTSGNSNAHFYSSASGTSTDPITLEAYDASARPVLQGASYSSKNVIHITGSYWVIRDIEVKTGKKGIMLDNSDYTKVQNCEVHDIGEEAIHLRDGTSNAEVTGCYVHHTGNYTVQFGEGIYIGSDNGKWGTFVKECDHNLISDNRIGPEVTAEHIDLKEGSSFNTIEYNTFDGAGIKDETNGGLSFMDVKGNDNVIRANCGFQNGNALLLNAFEVHVKVSGWGENNTFINNHIEFSSGNASSYVVQNPSTVTTTTAGCNVRTPAGNMVSSSVGPASCNNADTPVDCSLAGGGSGSAPVTVHVQDILTYTQSAGQGNKHGAVEVTVHDDLENPVAGATVTGTFSGTFNETVSGATGSDGRVVLLTTGTAKGGVTVSFCVDDITHSSLTYDVNQNDITCR